MEYLEIIIPMIITIGVAILKNKIEMRRIIRSEDIYDSSADHWTGYTQDLSIVLKTNNNETKINSQVRCINCGATKHNSLCEYCGT